MRSRETARKLNRSCEVPERQHADNEGGCARRAMLMDRMPSGFNTNNQSRILFPAPILRRRSCPPAKDFTVSNNQELFKCRANVTSRQDVVVKRPDGALKLNLVWTDKTKGKLRVMTDRLIFKNLLSRPSEIPYVSMKTAILLSTKMAFVKFYVLWVAHTEGSNGIAFRYNPFWDGPLPFPVVRESAKYSTVDLLKAVAESAATSLIGEAAEGVIGSASIAGRVAGKLANVTTSQASGAALDNLADKLAGQASKSSTDGQELPRYVIRRGEKKSKALTREKLIAMLMHGKVRPNDQVLDIKTNKLIRSKSLIEKYG